MRSCRREPRARLLAVKPHEELEARPSKVGDELARRSDGNDVLGFHIAHASVRWKPKRLRQYAGVLAVTMSRWPAKQTHEASCWQLKLLTSRCGTKPPNRVRTILGCEAVEFFGA